MKVRIGYASPYSVIVRHGIGIPEGDNTEEYSTRHDELSRPDERARSRDRVNIRKTIAFDIASKALLYPDPVLTGLALFDHDIELQRKLLAELRRPS